MYQKYWVSQILGIRNIRYRVSSSQSQISSKVLLFIYCLTKPQYVFDYRSLDQSRSKKNHHEIDTTKDNSEETAHIETEESSNQKKITEYFLQQMRKESENGQKTNEREDIPEEVDPTSTQQWIHDARERRLNEMRSRINCDKCKFKTTSMTALKLHENSNHKDKKEHKNKNRIKCEECDKKFNKESTYKTHMQKVHHDKNVRKRKQEGQHENSEDSNK